MRKIIAILLVAMLIASMAVSAYAVTPKWEYKPSNLPQIKPDTSFVQGIVANWFNTNPIEFPAINISFTSPVLK